MKKLLRSIVVWVLDLETRIVLAKYRPKIVAVTGSVGKTTTKDMVTALIKDLNARGSSKSYNTEFGLPLTVLGCENAWSSISGWLSNFWQGLRLILARDHNYPGWLILETGVEFPGDMRRLVRYIKPDVCIVTGFGTDIPVHTEYFDGPKAILLEKELLVAATKPDGLVILNGDDDRALTMRRSAKGRVATFGFKPSNDTVLLDYEVSYNDQSKPDGICFSIKRGTSTVNSIWINGVVGGGYAYSALAAFATALSLGIEPERARELMSTYSPSPGRANILDGAGDSTIIDGSYNLSAGAARLIINDISKIKIVGRKIIALSIMTEIGGYAEAEHQKIGGLIAKSDFDQFCAVDDRYKYYAAGALAAGMSEDKIKHFDRAEECGKFLRSQLASGDLVLVKGAQSRRMERAVKEILLDPRSAEGLLVRQDPKWLSIE